MAQIQDDGGAPKKGGKKRAKRGMPHVDMTPMVDLAFLLLTFFVMTSTFSKPKVMSLVYPAKPDPNIPIDPKQQEINNAVTFLLSENRIFYYEGAFYPKNNDKGKPPTQLLEADFGQGKTGVRALLADLNRFVLQKKEGYDKQLKDKQIADTTWTRLMREAKSDNKALKVLIKTDELALTKNFIDLVDELTIASIGVIAPVDLMASEKELMDEKIK